MLAYTDSGGAMQVWNGQPVRGIAHQTNIDQLWSDADLNAAGIYRVQEFVAPQGQQIGGPPTYTLQGNVVLQTYPTVPLPSPKPAPVAKGAGSATIAG